jgi:hypothetical protein
MSDLDFELKTLRAKLASLEEKKRRAAEEAAKNRANPLQTLERILHEKVKKIELNSYSKSIPLARFYDEEKVAYLEPIFLMLKSMDERLSRLENVTTKIDDTPTSSTN